MVQEPEYQHLARPDRVVFKGLYNGDPLDELGAHTVGLADGTLEGENVDLVQGDWEPLLATGASRRFLKPKGGTAASPYARSLTVAPAS